MAGKLCPFLSADAPRDCLEADCMMYAESALGGACGFVKAPQQISSRIDTLSAQIQEMQVALIKLTNA